MYSFVKRVLDICAATTIMVVSFPLIVFALVGSAIVHRSTPLFIQQRTGKGGEPFNVYKVKSMRDEAPDSDNADGARLTAFGQFLRKTSLDELPQLLNILRGEMSFVGPRPQMHSYYDLLSLRERERCTVVPGLTGWSQINGRNDITWRKRFEQDLWYVDNACFTLDLLILWRTVLIVLNGRGVSSANHVTMPPPHQELMDVREALPEILAQIVRGSPDTAVTFSLHSADGLQPTSTDPRDLFLLNDRRTGDHVYGNIYLDIWRRPNGSAMAFPIGTAGPFDVTVADGTVTVAKQPLTVIHRDKQKRFELSVKAAAASR